MIMVRYYSGKLTIDVFFNGVYVAETEISLRKATAKLKDIKTSIASFPD
jgi:hypothetical protein